MKAYTPEVMQKAENYMFDNMGVSALGLMKKAATEMYTSVEKLLPYNKQIVVLCGKGNNAGDGYELARLIQVSGIDVCCVMAFGSEPSTDIAKKCYKEYCECGGKAIPLSDEALVYVDNADVIIDAVFGIGFKGEIEKNSRLYELVEKVNSTKALKIALDVPSGINCCDGSVGGVAFDADITVTVTAPKIGMLSYPAKDLCGEIITIDIGVPEKLLDSYECSHIVLDDEYVKKALPKRKTFSNKGDFGKLLCICGCENMPGAAGLAIGAALRAGTGLVTLASEMSVCKLVQTRYLEPVYTVVDFDNEADIIELIKGIDKYSAVLIGCGLGKAEYKKRLVVEIIKKAECQLIIDADGINMLSDNINVLREAKKAPILTPHPGEFSRITGESIDYINANRIKCTIEFSKSTGCITVLKGAGTVVSSPEGIIAVNTTGNAGLAKGGSGDVLAGLIAGLAANPEVDAFDAAVCGVYLHGKAADVLKEKYSEYGLLPSELAGEFAKMLP